MRAAALLLALALAACAGPAAAPTRADLESRVAAAPDDATALRDLGAFLALDGDYPAAIDALARALAINGTDGQTLFLAGLVYEANGRVDQAEGAYARYLSVDAGDAYRDSLRGRLDALVRARLRTQFATALATEDSLDSIDGADAVAVLPFAYRGDDPTYNAIGRGLAEVVSVDLASLGSLPVVERIRLQALLAESELARAGVLDPATAPRTGRMLRADRLVGGEIDVQGQAVRIESAVWQGTLRGIETTEGGITDLLRVQNQVTLDVLASLGIVLSEQARAQILEPETEDILAFLLFSRALLLEDDGDYAGADRLFGEAIARDPGFGLAARTRDNASLSAASTAPAGATLAAGVAPPGGVAGVTSSLVARRSAALRESLGGHVVPGSETREPGVEGSEAGALGPLPAPPPPPGRNAP
ncbi:CsgG/HfaB family protein [Rubrivirga sp. IMCC43871]|uniref:CsgG/HfaB family protein n=1 Tax=Rubrivirga sp. IMCC43871 TaxID=3391575 RepID=UPI00398FFCA1